MTTNRLLEIKNRSKKIPCTYLFEDHKRKGHFYELMDEDYKWLIEKVEQYEQALEEKIDEYI
ncbi:hypothetical protein [Alkalihalobacterium alkalinitrilicum]|uniref:hypothetical protein n=1 Tax=Alkalihalobacterium alkalinitrilicum TaxID=427920 RepID=UPI000995AD52|nr:hypothetical protein [Alkalihalobacterium alkalinitrilicum]